MKSVLNKIQNPYWRLNALIHYHYFKKIKAKNYKRRKKHQYDPNFLVKELLNNIDIPTGKIIFLHVGLKELKSLTQLSYWELTKSIVENIDSLFSPEAIVVPTFSWTFTKSGLYSINYSRSEAGVFSENFRKLSNYRTPNAIQNFSVITDNVGGFENNNHTDTFSEDGIYNYFFQHETYIVDIGTDTFRDSPLHHVERSFNVEYLKDKENVYKGILLDSNDKPKQIKQFHGGAGVYKGYFVWNKEKIENFLERNGVINKYFYKGIKITYFKNQEQYNVLGEKLNENPYFLVTL